MSKNYYNFCPLTISWLLLLPIVFSLQIYTRSFNHFVGSTPLSLKSFHMRSSVTQQQSHTCVRCQCSAEVTHRTKGLAELPPLITSVRLHSVRIISHYLLFILQSGILEFNVSQLKTTHIFWYSLSLSTYTCALTTLQN